MQLQAMPARLANETFGNTEGLPALQSFELATGKGRFEGRQTEEEKGVRMSYNIIRWNTKKLEGFTVPLDAFYKHQRKDWHPDLPEGSDLSVVLGLLLT